RHELALSLRAAGDVVASLAMLEAIVAESPEHRPSVVARIDTLGAADDAVGLEKIFDAELRLGLSCADPTRRLLSAELVCKALPHLSPTTRPAALRLAAPLVNSAAVSLPAASLWDVCLAADVSGAARDYQEAATALLQHENLSLDLCRAILSHLHRGGDPDWVKLGESLGMRLGPGDAWLYRLGLMALTCGAETALARRKVDRAQVSSTAITATIHGLLRQAGRLRLAERYLRRARRALPLHAPTLNAHVSALIAIGKAKEAREVLDEAAARAEIPQATLQAMRTSCLLHIGELEEALVVHDGIEVTEIRSRQLGSINHALFGHGHVEVAMVQSAEVRRTLPPKAAAHFGVTFSGILLTERLVMGEDGAAKDVRDSVLAAVRSISSWRSRGFQEGYGRVPHQMMQYWNTPQPPADIASIMATWEGTKGIDYQRFDRQSARHFLASRLGKEWETAFSAANSPAEESDYFRLCWIMLEGGMYVDGDDRLVGDASALIGAHRGLTVYAEPHGFISNNLVLAPPHHPAIVWAAAAARRALAERHNDSTWSKTGPGLLSRAVAWYLSRTQARCEKADLTIRPRWELGREVQVHVPLPYKSTRRYWNAAGKIAGSGAVLLDVYRRNVRGN
ncbi:hypothetical protein, partial [Cyanobium sp. Aljojuca 7A6]